MLTYLVVVLPGVFAAFLYYKLLGIKMERKGRGLKLLCRTLFYALCIGLLISGGLWLIGISRFNLFEVSLKFKVGWLILGIILAPAAIFVFDYPRKENLLGTLKRLFPAECFIVVTYAIFAPSSLFLENINEFSLHYIKIIPIISVKVLVFWICISAIACIINGKCISYYISLIFSISLSVYVQMNFLNPKFPVLDGAEIDWTIYSTERRISTIFWLLLIFIFFIMALFLKQKAECAMKYGAYFLSAVQLVSLVVLIMTNKLDATAEYGFSKDGEFAIGTEENIIIFIVDSLQSATLEEYLISDAYKNQLNDFIFFDNVVSGGAPTYLGLSVLLTGIEYDPMQPLEEYQSEIWQETQLYDDMHENNYDVRFFTTHTSIRGAYDMVDNYVVTKNIWIDRPAEFSRQFYKLVNLYAMPQLLKARYWLATDSIIETIASTENKENIYDLGNIGFNADLQTAEHLNKDYGKAFRLYHLNGVHMPFTNDENLLEVEENTVSEQQQLQGVMKEIYAYIGMMKEAGVYDTSTILISGDHGQHGIGNPEANPAVLIKRPYESHILEHNSAPVHFRNVVATMAQSIVEDYSSYGPSVYDITENSDVERLHTIRAAVGSRIGLEGSESYRLMILGDARDGEYQVWNPYEINCIEYKVGDIIDYTAPNDYADKINYRLYKENGTAVASNELSICFNLKDHQNDDLKFDFTYSHVYNDSQKIYVYANGKKLENVICTQKDAGSKIEIKIPKDIIEDDVLIIRMMFPNAVTPRQIAQKSNDTRVLSIAFDTMWLE